MNLYFCRYDSPSMKITMFCAASDEEEAAFRLTQDAYEHDVFVSEDDVEVTHIDVVDGYEVELN